MCYVPHMLCVRVQYCDQNKDPVTNDSDKGSQQKDHSIHSFILVLRLAHPRRASCRRDASSFRCAVHLPEYFRTQVTVTGVAVEIRTETGNSNPNQWLVGQPLLRAMVQHF